MPCPGSTPMRDAIVHLHVLRRVPLVGRCCACGCRRCASSAVHAFVCRLLQLRSALTAGWTINTRTGKGLVATAMARGYWKTAEELITHSKTVRADVTHAVYKSASSIRKQLKTLEEALNKRRSVSKGCVADAALPCPACRVTQPAMLFPAASRQPSSGHNHRIRFSSTSSSPTSLTRLPRWGARPPMSPSRPSRSLSSRSASPSARCSSSGSTR